MKMNFRLLTILLLLLVAGILSSTTVLAGSRLESRYQEETATPMPSVPSPAEIIDAVN